MFALTSQIETYQYNLVPFPVSSLHTEARGVLRQSDSQNISYNL